MWRVVKNTSTANDDDEDDEKFPYRKMRRLNCILFNANWFKVVVC